MPTPADHNDVLQCSVIIGSTSGKNLPEQNYTVSGNSLAITTPESTPLLLQLLTLVLQLHVMQNLMRTLICIYFSILSAAKRLPAFDPGSRLRSNQGCCCPLRIYPSDSQCKRP